MNHHRPRGSSAPLPRLAGLITLAAFLPATAGCSTFGLERTTEAGRVVDLPPVVSQEPGPPSDAVIVEPAGDTGALDFRYETQRPCISTVVLRSQTMERATYRARPLPTATAYFIGIFATAIGGIFTVAALRSDADSRNSLLKIAAPLDVVGLASLGTGVYFTVKDGTVEEIPGEIVHRPAPASEPLPRATPTICEREPVAGVTLELLLTERGKEGSTPFALKLGTTGPAGSLRFDLAKALATRFPGWPRANVALSEAAAVVTSGAPDKPLRTINLSRYPALRLRENHAHAGALGAPGEPQR